MTKTLPILLVAAVVLGAGAFYVRTVVESKAGERSATGAYVNPEIAEAYEAYLQAVNDAAAARKALATAAEADPDNGYTDFLLATIEVDEGQTDKASEILERGAAKPKVIHYVATAQAHEGMTTLTRLRRFSMHGKDLADKDATTAERFFEAVREAGYKMATMEPVTVLGVGTAISVIRQNNGNAAEYFAAKGNAGKADEWSQRRDRFEAWSKDFNELVKEQVGQVVEEAGKRAGLTEAEIADVAMMKPLADPKRQEKVEQVMAEMLEEEKKLLRTLVAEMPR